MSNKLQNLRIQMSLAMIFTAITSLAIFIIGMATFYTYLQQNWMDGLSSNNQDTLNRLLENKQIDEDSLTTLVNAFSMSWIGEYADQEFLALLFFVVFSILVSLIIGSFVAGKLSRPIEVITDAASRVAKGAYDFQLDQQAANTREASDLVRSFNHMTKSLVNAERDSTESAAAIAHELRTPLTVLRGRLQGFRDGVFEPTDHMYDALIGQVDTLANIADDLGTLSNLSSGKFQLESISIDLAEEVRRVLIAVSPDLENEGIELHTSLEPVNIYADPARIRQALTSLIENVRRYAASGKYIKIETVAQAPFATLKVTDHGPGIPKEDWSRVFDRWWRGEDSRSRSQGGSGLGLSIVKAIALAHNGHVSVSESPSEQSGSCFSISLPINSQA
jgi:two-component system sensor histidine kinase AdeS